MSLTFEEALQGIRNNTLTYCNLAYQRIDDTKLEILTTALENNHSVSAINLAGNNIGSTGLDRLVSKINKGRNDTSIGLEVDKTPSFLTALAKNQHITEINLADNPLITAPHGLNQLWLSNLLRSNLSIVSINLEGTICIYTGSIGGPNLEADIAAATALQGLKQNRKIKLINLGRNCIGDNGAKELAKIIEGNKSITSINLQENLIYDEGVKSIAKALEKNQSITKINLSWNRFEDVGTMSIAGAIEKNKSIFSIDLSFTPIQNKGAIALAKALEKNQSLAEINLLGCDGIKATEAVAIAEALKKNKRLTTIKLHGVHISETGIEALSIALEDNYSITILDLALEYRETDSIKIDKINALLTRNKKLAKELLTAAQQKILPTVKELLSKGVSPYAKNEDGNTILHIAAKNDDVELLEYLFSLDLNTRITNNTGQTVFDLMTPETKKELDRRKARREFESLKTKGITSFRLKKYRDALDHFNQALSGDVFDTECYEYRAATKKELKDFEGAKTDYQTAMRLSPSSQATYQTKINELDLLLAFAHSQQGDTLRSRGDNDSAILEYSTALHLNPNDKVCYHHRALAYFSQKKYPEALADINRAIDIDATCSAFFITRGDINQATDQLLEAKVDYEKALELNVRNRSSVQPKLDAVHKSLAFKHRGLGNTKKLEGDHAGAILEFNTAIQFDPTDDYSFSLRGRSHQELGQHPEAKQDFTEALRLKSNDPFSLLFRGHSKKALNDLEGAIADYDLACHHRPEFKESYGTMIQDLKKQIAAAHAEQGHQKKDQNDFEGALSEFETSLQYNPEEAAALQPVIYTLKKDLANRYTDQGRQHRQAKDYVKAIAALTQAIGLNGLVALTFIERGLAHYESKQFQKSRIDFDRALELDPNQPEARLHRARARMALQDPVGALNDYETACEQQPSLREIHAAEMQSITKQVASSLLKAGDAKKDRKDFNGALSDYNQAMQHDSSNPELFVARAWVYEKLNQPTEALADVEKAIQLDASYRSKLQSQKKNLKKRIVEISSKKGKTLQQADKHPEAIAAFSLAILNSANIQKRRPAARRHDPLSISDDPQRAELFFNRGFSYFKMSDDSNAEQDFTTAIQLTTNHPRPAWFFQRALVLMVQKKYSEALSDFENAIQLNPSVQGEVQPHLIQLYEQLLEKTFGEEQYDETIQYADRLLQFKADHARALELLQKIDRNIDVRDQLSNASQLCLKKYLGIIPTFQQLFSAFNIPISIRYVSESDQLHFMSSDRLFLYALQRYFSLNIKLDATLSANHTTMIIHLNKMDQTACDECVENLASIPRADFLMDLTQYLTAMNIELRSVSHSSVTQKVLNYFEKGQDANPQSVTLPYVQKSQSVLLEAMQQYHEAYQTYQQSLEILWQTSIVHQQAQQVLLRRHSPMAQQRATQQADQLERAKKTSSQAALDFQQKTRQLKHVYAAFTENKLSYFEEVFRSEQKLLSDAVQQQGEAAQTVMKLECTAQQQRRPSSLLKKQLQQARIKQSELHTMMPLLEQQMDHLWQQREKSYEQDQAQHWNDLMHIEIDFEWFVQTVFLPAYRDAIFQAIQKLSFSYTGSFNQNDPQTFQSIVRIIFHHFQDANLLSQCTDPIQLSQWQSALSRWIQHQMDPITEETQRNKGISFHGRTADIVGQASVQWTTTLRSGSLNWDGEDEENQQATHASFALQSIDDAWWRNNQSSLPDDINWYALLSFTQLKSQHCLAGCDGLPFFMTFESNDKRPSTNFVWNMMRESLEEEQTIQPSAPPISSAASTQSSRSFSSVRSSLFGLFRPTAPESSSTKSRCAKSSSTFSQRFRPTAPPLSDISSNQSFTQWRFNYLGSQLPIAPRSIYIDPKELIIIPHVTLGKGGFGIVKKGTWGATKTEVAVKQIPIDQMDEKTIEDFHREITLSASFAHPNITPFYGVCLESGQCSLVMAYQKKGSLYRVLHSNEELPWNVRYKIAKGVVQGLGYLHDRDVVHRDIKSSNILLNRSYDATIADFGLSKICLKTNPEESSEATNGSEPIKLTGTLLYLAPELLKGEGDADQARDIFALGMVLYEIATREILYKDTNDDREIRRRIRDGILPSIPEDVEREYPSYAKLIRWCWEKDPKARPTIRQAAELLRQNPFEDFEEEEPFEEDNDVSTVAIYQMGRTQKK